MLVLVVDDDAVLRRGLVRAIRKQHPNVLQAASVAEACDLVTGGARPGRILCDVMMPGGIGPELHSWLAQEHPDLASRMIFMTGGVPSEWVRRALAATRQPVLTKPMKPSALLAALGDILGAPPT